MEASHVRGASFLLHSYIAYLDPFCKILERLVLTYDGYLYMVYCWEEGLEAILGKQE